MTDGTANPARTRYQGNILCGYAWARGAVCQVPAHVKHRHMEIEPGAVSEHTQEIDRLTRQNHGLFKELNEAADILAEALGYTYDRHYGWITGDHTTVTLAMEARTKMGELQAAQTTPQDQGTVRIPRTLWSALGCSEDKIPEGTTVEIVEDADAQQA